MPFVESLKKARGEDIFIMVFSSIFLLIGVVDMYVALDGARLLPNAVSIVEVDYSAAKALKVFVLGQAYAAVSAVFLYFQWRLI